MDEWRLGYSAIQSLGIYSSKAKFQRKNWH